MAMMLKVMVFLAISYSCLMFLIEGAKISPEVSCGSFCRLSYERF